MLASANDSLDERLRFLALTDADAARLVNLRPLFEAQATEFVEAFYRHLFAFKATAGFLQDEERFARLKRVQREHFDSLFEAVWDEAYFERRRKVGLTHADVGIEPQYFLGAYNQLVQHCAATLSGSTGDPASARRIEELASLIKVILLDVGLSLDAYFEQSTRRLQHALDMLWKANDELRRFAQLTTHDLKTPLATVANLCDEALDEFGPNMPDEAKKLVESARQATYRMSSQIDELLSLAVGAGTEADRPVDSDAAVRQAAEGVSHVLRERVIALRIEDHLPPVVGNAIRLREAFYNLLSNAAKFIPAREGVIQVTAETHDGDVIFRVRDNGPGIPHDELDRIFVPFRRLPAHRNQPGSGLGLYFTKNLVEQQGGQIWAESNPGEGACFCIRMKGAGKK
jgi:signal transduction histidine kinase